MSGYQEDFIEGLTLPLPQVPSNIVVCNHPHFTIQYDTSKKIAFLTAANVDASKLKASFGNRSNKLDPNLLPEVQHTTDWYRHDPYDKGHMVRRKLVRWGESDAEAAEAEQASDYWSNIVPHSDANNHDKWKSVESAILRIAHCKAKDKKINVYAGSYYDPEYPKLDDDINGSDLLRKVPNAYWNAVAYIDSSNRRKTIKFFWVSHEGNTLMYDDDLIYRGWNAHSFIRTIKEVESKIGVDFPECWHVLGDQPLPSKKSGSALRKGSNSSLKSMTKSSSYYWSEGACIDSPTEVIVDSETGMTRNNSEYWGF